MKEKLSKWKGKFLVDHKMYTNLDKLNFKQGEQIKIKLLAKRRETR